jgi:pimeloyl-ACP methyl ester carboxylesterase
MDNKKIELKHGVIPFLEDGSGTPLLFLHGAIATPLAYQPILELLAKRFRVIAPTHPGHGEAFSIFNTWRLIDFVETYREFIQKLDFIPQVIVGHSFGGTLALLLARHFSNASIVVLDAPGLPLRLDISTYIKFMIREADDVIRLRPELATVEKTMNAAGIVVETVIRHPEDIPWLLTHMTSLDITPELSLIRNRVHLLWGADDKIVPSDIGEAMQTFIHRSKLIIFPGRGHIYPVTEAEFTHKEILKALAKY